MGPRNVSALSVVLFLLFVVNSAFFTVSATERAVLLRFGEVVEADLQPGLHFKIPMVHEVRRFDARLQVSDAERTEFLTKESKFLIIDAYVMWRVDDVKRFFTATGGDFKQAESRLLPLVRDGLKNRVSERTVKEVVSGQREQLMLDLTKAANEVASREFGIQVIDVRVKRVDFPNSTLESIYNRMRTERERVSIVRKVRKCRIASSRKRSGSSVSCWPRPIARLKPCVVRAMPRRLPFRARPLVRMPSSTSSIVPCRSIAIRSTSLAMSWF